MPGIKALRQIQIGQETTQGTPATPTTMWLGEGLLTPGEDRVFPAQYTGSLFPTSRSYTPVSKCEISLDETPVTFEQVGYLFDSVMCKVSGQADSTGSGKVYTWACTTTTVPATAAGTFTVRFGDNQEADEADFAHVTQLTLKGAGGEALTMQADLMAHGEADAEFATLAPVTVEEALFERGTLYLDATGSTIGTTPVAQTWLGVELVIPGWKTVYTADGSPGFGMLKHIGYGPGHEITGTLTLENNATGEAERGYARAGTRRLMRMKWTGSTLTTAGVYTAKTLMIDAVIAYDRTPALDEDDGDDTLVFPFRVVEGATADLTQVDGIKIVLVNQLAALP
jgi:hypothetical protein